MFSEKMEKCRTYQDWYISFTSWKESACGLITKILEYLDIRSLCNVKQSSLMQQLVKAYGCNDFERVREKALSVEFKCTRRINEMILSHLVRRLYLLIERYKREFPRGTAAGFEDQIPTPFVCACEHGRMDDVQLFMKLHPYHKYITNRDVNGYRDDMTLKEVVNQDYRDDMTLKEVVNQEGNNSRGNESNHTPLMVAAWKEHFQVVKYLIEQGEADPNIANGYGVNALHAAAVDNERNTELIELLLTHMTLDSINKKNWRDSLPWTMHIGIMIVHFAKRSLHFYVQKVEKQMFMMRMVDM